MSNHSNPPPGATVRRTDGPRAGFVLLTSFFISSAWSANPPVGEADHPEGHLHEPLTVSTELTWPELIDRTAVNYPQFVELSARDIEARTLMDRARSWFSSPASLAVRYQTDKPWDDVSLREYEFGLEVPLWRLGQRRAARSLGTAAIADSKAAVMALRHEVTGLLRATLWELERAENALGAVQDGARVAQELLRVVERRYEAGDLPFGETLLMRSTVLERQAFVIEAEALLVDAERAYQSLTGFNERPLTFAEPLTEREDFDAAHPWLALADTELGRARAEQALVSRAANGAPTLTIGPRRERAAFSDYSADSLGISVSMPFGGSVHRSAEIAAAARVTARAQAQRLQLLRQLELELHEARHSLLVIEASLELAQRRSALAARSFEMSQQAFTQGEMTLLELLRREETALSTQREVIGFEVARQSAIAQINQAIGVWP